MKIFFIQFLYWFTTIQIIAMLAKQLKAGYTIKEKKCLVWIAGILILPITTLCFISFLIEKFLPYRYIKNGTATEICLLTGVASIIVSISFTKKLIQKINWKISNENS